jgi:hypothetical protein
MRTTVRLVPTLTNDLVIMDDNTSYQWVRTNATSTQRSKLHRALHKNFILMVIVLRH